MTRASNRPSLRYQDQDSLEIVVASDEEHCLFSDKRKVSAWHRPAKPLR